MTVDSIKMYLVAFMKQNVYLFSKTKLALLTFSFHQVMRTIKLLDRYLSFIYE